MRSALVILAACGATAAPPQRSAPAPASEEAEPEVGSADESEVVTPEPATAEAPQTVPMRTSFDLTAQPERASFFWGDAEIIDVGDASGARHSLGGWSTTLGRGELDGVGVLLSKGRQGRLPFSWNGQGDARIRLAGRVIVNGPLQVYLGDTHIADVELPSQGWGSTEVVLPEEQLRQGENLLLLRARGSRTLSGIGRVGVALLRVSIGTALPPAADPSPSLREGTWHVPNGWRLSHALPLPAGARFQATIAEGAVRLTAAHDGGVEDLGRHETGEIDVALSGLEGQVARIEIEAVGDARIANAEIVEPAPERAEASRPTNVVLWLVDTLRADRLSPINPDTRVQTPGLAAFVRDASTFTHAHSQENWTKPSVATLLSGLMPWEHTATQQGSVVPRSVELLPETLGRHGFATASFICNGYVSDRFGFRQGWDTYRNYIREGRRTRARDVAADVLSWLDGRDEEKPFFLYVHTIDPHVPYRPPREYLEMYGDADYRGPIDFRRDSTLLENVKLGRLRLGERDKAHLQALYDGEITYHDAHFRSVLDGLERRGLADSTMVLVTSDHGEEFWDHGSVGHGHSVYEELLHVPLFVRLPGLPATRITTPVGLVDVMPTILDVLEKPVPEGVSGRSFLPQLEGRSTAAPRVTVSGFMDNWRTVTSGRWKLVVRPRRQARLYDLENDPRERTDLAADRPVTVRWLREMMALRLDATRARERRRGRRPHRAESTEIDDETAAQLRALGYVTE